MKIKMTTLSLCALLVGGGLVSFTPMDVQAVKTTDPDVKAKIKQRIEEKVGNDARVEVVSNEDNKVTVKVTKKDRTPVLIRDVFKIYATTYSTAEGTAQYLNKMGNMQGNERLTIRNGWYNLGGPAPKSGDFGDSLATDHYDIEVYLSNGVDISTNSWKGD